MVPVDPRPAWFEFLDEHLRARLTPPTISGSCAGARLRPGIPGGHRTRYAADTSLPDRAEPSSVAPSDLTAVDATIRRAGSLFRCGAR